MPFNHENPRILGVLAGKDFPAQRVAEWARSADVVFAADGGADTLFEHGMVPDETVGDFDSICNSTKESQTKLLYDPDQNSTDCDKLLAVAALRGYTRITLCGVEGDLMDHVMGTLFSAARSPLNVRLILRRGVALLLREDVDLTLDLPTETRLSFMPITECSGVSLSGVEWPLQEAVLSPLNSSSLSNRTVGPVRVVSASGAAALFLFSPVAGKSALESITISSAWQNGQVSSAALHLSPLDGAVILVFLAAILGLGFSAKLRDHSILQYLAAGRNLSMPAFVATLVSMWYGGILAIGDSITAFGIGSWLLLGVPYYLFASIYSLFFAKRVRDAEQISIPERLVQRWGRGAGLVGAGLVFLLAVPAAHVLMLGTMVHLTTGLELAPSVIVATVVGTLFLYKGGLLADVRAGLLAFAMMYIGFFVIAIWCLTHFPPVPAFHALDPSLKKWDGGAGWIGILTFMILGAWTLVDPGFHQRVSSARSVEIGRIGLYVCVGFWMLFDLLSMTAGLYAVSILKPTPSGLSFFPLLGDRVLPSGLKAVFLCGITGTILSAMVGYTLVSGATFGREFVARVKPGMDDHSIKTWTRVGFVVACILSIVLALNVKNVVVDLWYAYSGAVVGALLLPVCAIYLPRFRLKAPPLWATASMLAAFITSFAWLCQARRTDNPNMLVSIAGQDYPLGTLIPGLIVSAVVLGLGEVAGRRALKT